MIFRVAERWFVIVLMLVNMGVIDALTRPSLAAGNPDLISTDVPPITAGLVSGVYFCGFVLILMYWRRVLRAAHVVWPVVVFPALALASLLWSNAPLLTVRRSAFFALSTLLGIYLGERFSIEELARVLAQAACLMMLAIFVLYFVAPTYVIDYVAYVGAWKGLSGTKNTFGGYMAIAILILFLLRFQRFPWARYLFLAMAITLLFLSRSVTSLVTCVLMLAAMPTWRFAAARGKQRLLACTVLPLALCLGISLIWFQRESLLHLLGREATLTGRTALWPLVVAAILKRPVLGYGYGAFWSGINPDTLTIYMESKWLPVSSDNGYLDLCLAFGILGLVIFACVFARSFKLARRYTATEVRPIGLWPITFMLYFGLHAICEGDLLTPRSLDFLLFAAITTSIALHRPIPERLIPVRSARIPPPDRQTMSSIIIASVGHNIPEPPINDRRHRKAV